LIKVTETSHPSYPAKVVENEDWNCLVIDQGVFMVNATYIFLRNNLSSSSLKRPRGLSWKSYGTG